MENIPNIPRQVNVCQHRSCHQDGSGRVLKALKANPVEGVMVTGCGCLGLCGSGPIVLVWPEQAYYWHVKPKDTEVIIKEHLRGGKVVKSMLHTRIHFDPNEFD